MKNKLLALLILFVVIGGSASAFAYWDSLTVDQTGNSVTLGNGVTLTISSSTADSVLELVPASAIVKPGDTTSIVFTYNVKLDEAVTTALNLTTTVSNIQVGAVDNATLANVVVATTGGAVTVNGSDVQVTVTLTLNDPADEAAYTALQAAGPTITFDVNFTAAQ